MKTRARKKEDLQVLTEQFQNSKAAILLSFSNLTVDKDQDFRNELRETGAVYAVVKNTLARLAVKGTQFEEVTEHLNGVTSVAWTSDEPVSLSKVISKYVKDDKNIFEFKTGIVDGRVVTFSEVQTIASLPSKEELIGKLLFLLNAPAQRLATVLSAIPRDLAAVIKQVSERQGEAPAPAEEEAPKAEAKEETPAVEEKAVEGSGGAEATSEDAPADTKDEAGEAPAEEVSDLTDGGDAEAASEDTPADTKDEAGEAPAEEVSDSTDGGDTPAVEKESE